MEDEVFNENSLEDTVEIVDDTVVDNSIEETEGDYQISEEQLIQSLLLLINEQQNKEDDLEEDSALELEELAAEDSSDLEGQYYDLLVSINNKLEYIIEDNQVIMDYNKPHDLYTPLEQYSLTEVFIVFGLAIGLSSVLISFVKNNVFHFR